MDWISIGRKIKEHRKKCKLTQPELAKMIEKTESSIRKYEKGLVKIPTPVLEQIAQVLDTTPLELIGPEWIDLQIGEERLKELRQAIDSEKGMIAILEELYGPVESQEVWAEPEWCQIYYRIGVPPNTFILTEGKLKTLINATKAFLPALVDQVKDSRPEEVITQELLAEMQSLPKLKE